MLVMQGVCLLVSLAATAAAFTMMRKHNSETTPTSSTLGWQPISAGKNVPPNTVPIAAGGPVWCRGQTHGIWVSGAVIGEYCQVPFKTKVERLDKYDVLVSVNGSARLFSQPWDKFEALPTNIVTSPDVLLAVHDDGEGGVYAGYVDIKDGKKAYFVQGETSTVEEGGTLLREEEPLKYIMTDIVLDGKKEQVTLRNKTVHTFILRNPTNAEKDVVQLFSYEMPSEVYWGRIKGTVIALPTEVTYPGNVTQHYTWAMKEVFSTKQEDKLKFRLPPQTGVTVEVVMVIQHVEAPYRARLMSEYRDGVRMQRNIEGLHTDLRFSELVAYFSPIFSLNDNSTFDESEHQTIVLVTSTTTTTTTPSSPVNDGPIFQDQPTDPDTAVLPRPDYVGVGGALVHLPVQSILLGIIVAAFFIQ